jgi:hypothetical protein
MFFGKTSQGHSALTGGRTSEPSCVYYSDKKFQSLKLDGNPPEWSSGKVPLPGEYSMLNTSECPNDVSESFLSEILVVEAPEKYCLSAKCAKGILMRASKAERPLPCQLEKALEAIAWTPENQAAVEAMAKLLEKS